MAHYHEPPAKLTKAQWEKLDHVFKSAKQQAAYQKLRDSGNQTHRAGDLFTAEDVYSKGQDQFNDTLRKASSEFTLSRVDNYLTNEQVTDRADRKLALVRKPKQTT